MKSIKVVIVGPFNAGKTTLVKTLSEISMTHDVEVTSPQERAKKRTTTVGMDFGIVNIGEGYVVRLFGSPGQPRFSFMWRVFMPGTDGVIFMVDSSDREALPEAAREFARARSTFSGLPMVVAANKQDVPDAMPPEVVRFVLDVPSTVPVIPCVATDRGMAWRVLGTLLEEVFRVNRIQV
ncbi:MAG: ADP-ribosylation factor-like protein [Nitrososphaerota archaeon]|nr:ADP-ribosylation factor-like protein [Candidatus Calditenuis fumarioli]